ASALMRYFDTGAIEPDLPIAASGTPFQRAVWSAIARIGPARTATYRDIARAIGVPTGVRAVGAATGRNPVCIFIPCHRVIGSDGTLTGYAGGLDRKRALIALERTRLATAERAA
ncbi:MAG TPA: methylated-DNA--[protein]-cysteine S-methyltransferase, partial [Casimicrobiaceae bacterium]|nr:methylated-DNA--[protein]-cysteine S-methyltransferase [Casimicrobiaceae bacterium]